MRATPFNLSIGIEIDDADIGIESTTILDGAKVVSVTVSWREPVLGLGRSRLCLFRRREIAFHADGDVVANTPLPAASSIPAGASLTKRDAIRQFWIERDSSSFRIELGLLDCSRIAVARGLGPARARELCYQFEVARNAFDHPMRCGLHMQMAQASAMQD